MSNTRAACCRLNSAAQAHAVQGSATPDAGSSTGGVGLACMRRRTAVGTEGAVAGGDAGRVASLMVSLPTQARSGGIAPS